MFLVVRESQLSARYAGSDGPGGGSRVKYPEPSNALECALAPNTECQCYRKYRGGIHGGRSSSWVTCRYQRLNVGSRYCSQPGLTPHNHVLGSCSQPLHSGSLPFVGRKSQAGMHQAARHPYPSRVYPCLRSGITSTSACQHANLAKRAETS